MFSLARSQKFEFCPRAFYFRYFDSKDSWSDDLKLIVEANRLKEMSEMSRHFLIANLAKDFFYHRPKTPYEQRRIIYQECHKFNFPQEKFEALSEQLYTFTQSPFYYETSPALVTHLEIDAQPVISIGEQEVTGAVHLAWVETFGRLNIVKISKNQTTDLSFPILYAMKKFHVAIEKLNVGILDPTTWQCSWEAINWHALSEFQDQALSFKIGKTWEEFPPTAEISRCQICSYSEACENYENELNFN